MDDNYPKKCYNCDWSLFLWNCYPWHPEWIRQCCFNCNAPILERKRTAPINPAALGRIDD